MGQIVRLNAFVRFNSVSVGIRRRLIGARRVKPRRAPGAGIRRRSAGSAHIAVTSIVIHPRAPCHGKIALFVHPLLWNIFSMETWENFGRKHWKSEIEFTHKHSRQSSWLKQLIEIQITWNRSAVYVIHVTDRRRLKSGVSTCVIESSTINFCEIKRRPRVIFIKDIANYFNQIKFPSL